jgi:dTDP-4-amino-4,6-dideoxygalactose transaminase
MADIEQVAALAPGLPVIEDAAQSIGARRSIDGEWRMAGEAATIGTFSFFPSKNLGGYGDGGMMVTQDERLYTRLLRLRTHGSVKTYYHEEVGYNSRLDTLQAAVLRAKLPHLGRWSAQRREHADYYTRAFLGLESHLRPPVIRPANESIFNQYTIRTERRDALQAHLQARGIGTSIYYPLPLHLQPCFAYLGYRAGQLPESERASREVLSLPVYPELTRAQQDEVIGAVREFYQV